MGMNQRVEFIESYIKIGNGDYQWNDNHGELIRCKDCKWFHQAFKGEGRCIKHDNDYHDSDWFCADGERKSTDEILMEEMDADPLG